MDIYIYTRLEGNRLLLIKNLDSLFVASDHPLIILGKFGTILLQSLAKFLDAHLVAFRLCLLNKKLLLLITQPVNFIGN